MLTLSRKDGQRIIIQNPHGTDIVIVVKGIDRGKCRVGIEAPDDYVIMREELLAAKTPAELGKV